MSQELENSSRLLANKLAAISLDDIEEILDIRLNNESVLARAHDAEIFYNSHMEKKLKKMTYEQLLKLAKESTTNEQTQFGRGIIYGLSLIDEWFIAQKGIVAGQTDQEEDNSITSQ